jgi:hypothetical protein
LLRRGIRKRENREMDREESCDHYWVPEKDQAIGHLTEIRVRCIKCPEKRIAHLV